VQEEIQNLKRDQMNEKLYLDIIEKQEKEIIQLKEESNQNKNQIKKLQDEKVNMQRDEIKLNKKVA
jgi:hypothetical protein